MKIQLYPPLVKIRINQGFGKNLVNFYKKLGLLGHNALDLWAKRNTPIYAAHDGIIVRSNRDRTGGIAVEILSNKKGAGYKTIYYHNKRNTVSVGDIVKQGQLIAYADNTGKYTTGDHLHFGLKLTMNGIKIDKNNGFRGAVDPALYMVENWDKSRAYHRYGRERNWYAEFCMRFAPINVKNRWTEAGRYIHRASTRMKFLVPLSGERVNALIYGGWDLKAVVDPAMTQIWRWQKKDEFLKSLNK